MEPTKSPRAASRLLRQGRGLGELALPQATPPEGDNMPEQIGWDHTDAEQAVKTAMAQTPTPAEARVLALPRGGFLARAEEELYEIGFFGKSGEDALPEGDYVTVSVRVGRQMLSAIRAVDDDREVLGDIAKQLVILGIPFRLVTVR